MSSLTGIWDAARTQPFLIAACAAISLLMSLRWPRGSTVPLKQAARASRLLARAGVWHVILIGLTLSLTWIFLIADLRQEYRHAVESAQLETSSLARGLGETTLASFDTIDQTLKDLREAYIRDPAHFDIRTWFDDHRFGTGLIIQASIIGPDGIVVQSNLPMHGRTDLSDREHVKFQKDPPATRCSSASRCLAAFPTANP